MASPIVGIPLDTLIQLIVMAFATPIIFVVLWWLLWVPRPAKEFCAAKLHKDDVNAEATDAGTLKLWRGKAEGPGVFYGKKDKVSFIHRSTEDWVNKRFSADKIGVYLSYSGMGISANPKHIALLTTNRLLHSDMLLQGKAELDLSVLPANVRKSLEKCHLNVQTEVEQNDDNGEEAAETQPEFTTERRQAVLLEPRILYDANTEMIGQDVIQYVRNKAYQKGFEEGQKPLLYRALPLLFALGLILLAMALAFTGGVPAA